MDYVLVKYAHLLGILFLFACLVAEHLLIKPELSRQEVKRLAIIDSVYGGAALLTLLAGLLLWFAVGKPAGFYNSNPVFHVKVTLFIGVGLLSIYPTQFFIRKRRSRQELVVVPRNLIRVIRVELLVLLLLPLMAVFMAQGYGLQ